MAPCPGVSPSSGYGATQTGASSIWRKSALLYQGGSSPGQGSRFGLHHCYRPPPLLGSVHPPPHPAHHPILPSPCPIQPTPCFPASPCENSLIGRWKATVEGYWDPTTSRPPACVGGGCFETALKRLLQLKTTHAAEGRRGCIGLRVTESAKGGQLKPASLHARHCRRQPCSQCTSKRSLKR